MIVDGFAATYLGLYDLFSQRIKISDEIISEASELNSQGLTKAAWDLLASASDDYADNAAAILDGNPCHVDDIFDFRSMVEGSWVVAGADLSKFDDVARDYQDLYLQHLQENNGYVPDTAQIEGYYTAALNQSGNPPALPGRQ